MTGWQTATRPDLTGPFTETTNTNVDERPPVPAGVTAGFRQTIGNPGSGSPNTVRTILYLFESASAAQAGAQTLEGGYESLAYTDVVDPIAVGLDSTAWARSGTHVFVAPQYAQGTGQRAFVFIWQRANLLLVEIVASYTDRSFDVAAAKPWVQDVGDNAIAAMP